jgi:hypothetical protein
LKLANRSTANDVARRQLEEGRARLSTTSGVRSGAASGLEAEVASRTGASVAEGDRQVELAAAQQRLPDILRVVQALSNFQGQRDQFARDEAQARLGAGGVIGGLRAPVSPLEGIGSFAGGLTSAAGSAGGFPNLFTGGGK